MDKVTINVPSDDIIKSLPSGNYFISPVHSHISFPILQYNNYNPASNRAINIQYKQTKSRRLISPEYSQEYSQAKLELLLRWQTITPVPKVWSSSSASFVPLQITTDTHVQTLGSQTLASRSLTAVWGQLDILFPPCFNKSNPSCYLWIYATSHPTRHRWWCFDVWQGT